MVRFKEPLSMPMTVTNKKKKKKPLTNNTFDQDLTQPKPQKIEK